jgi:hypothetical protein
LHIDRCVFGCVRACAPASLWEGRLERIQEKAEGEECERLITRGCKSAVCVCSHVWCKRTRITLTYDLVC